MVLAHVAYRQVGHCASSAAPPSPGAVATRGNAILTGGCDFPTLEREVSAV